MSDNDFQGKIDAKGKVELYQRFWAKIRELVAAPEVSERLVRAIGRKRAIDWYDIRDYDLGVEREEELITDFPRDGDCILVLSITSGASASIKFSTGISESFDLAEYRRFRHNFSNLYLTNSEQSGMSLTLLLGKGNWEVVRHHPEEGIASINADTVDYIHARRY